jgi:predicted phosphodiesterase
MYCVISDIHSNLEALTAVLAAIDSLGAPQLLCLGDLVGYGADPDSCVKEVLSRARLCVRGNHDKAVSRQLSLEWFNPVARAAALWTRENALPRTIQAVAALPEGPVEAGRGVLLCHGSPMDEDMYLTDRRGLEEARRWLLLNSPRTHVCFHGHTHSPLAMRFPPGEGRGEALGVDGEINLEKGAVYLINPGSVGQPRDGNAMASFGILDLDGGTYRTVRVPYEIRDAQRKITKAGLPAELARRLGDGW